MKISQVVTAFGTIVLAVVGGSMVVTNPGQATYEDYAVEQLSKYLKEEVCPQAPETLGSFLRRQCTILVDTGRPQIKQVVAQTTKRENFLLFSIYRTDLDVSTLIPSYSFETVGICQQFYLYKADEKSY
ncbi:MAG: DUF4359 domain-containing protein [Moorea sp. SIO1F2]|uniref:DUF4359 domain-containing protein n=1 Tax=unclassified Moorena TaxID=2683338 RepID=UPI0013B95207|nr:MULTISPECIES: DUF4359 domain-containing protein [unclassified Moorena]NEN96533.1 DUF4359 domain-containing protein [Moorena sp. SIO3I7]NEO60242.1 DUF4359 domain-containing protein [Moorena sp. SIO4G2]NEO07543.1 DUF4359 domain-containing protein [Moorena sp. SIO3I8]NEP25690.1 DUF4359 domain-containing protein [Moorena sp. SIO3I6]NEQ60797.1 DUF4359 domain-containing protein [Moorena sp. SIO4A1]